MTILGFVFVVFPLAGGLSSFGSYIGTGVAHADSPLLPTNGDGGTGSTDDGDGGPDGSCSCGSGDGADGTGSGSSCGSACGADG